MYKIKVTVAILVAILPLTVSICSGQAVAEVEFGATSGSFLKIGVGARPSAMGDAFVAVVGDVNSIYWNPAAIGGVKKSQISLTHAEWLAGVRYEWVGFAQPINRWLTLGGSASLLNSGEIPRTVESEGSIGGYETDGVFKFANSSYGIAAGTGVYRNMRLGVSVQILGQKLSYNRMKRREAADLSAQSFVVSWGGLYQTPVPELMLGASLQNLNSEREDLSDGGSSPIPTRLKVGASYEIQMNPEIEPEAEDLRNLRGERKVSQEDKIILALDASLYSDVSPRLHLGSEYALKSGLSIRGGYRSGAGLDFISNFSGGLGYKADSYEVDYALVPFGDLGSTHRISFTLQF